MAMHIAEMGTRQPVTKCQQENRAMAIVEKISAVPVKWTFFDIVQ